MSTLGFYFQDIRRYESFWILTTEAQTQTDWPPKKTTLDIGTQIPRRSEREASLRCSILIKKYTKILKKNSDDDDDSNDDYDNEQTILPAQKRKKRRECKNGNKIQKIAQ